MGRYKYIAALEISSEEVRFGVSRMSYVTNSFMVVHKARFQGKWYENEKIINREEIISLLKKSIAEFEGKFSTTLQEISVVIPDFSSGTVSKEVTENFPENKQITKFDFDQLTLKAKKMFTNDFEQAIKLQTTAYFINGQRVQTKNIRAIGNKIGIKVYITVAKREILNDHKSIILDCGKKCATSFRTTSMAHREVLVSGDTDPVNVIVNWMNKKVVISLHVNGVLMSVREWNHGVDDIADMIVKKTEGVKHEFIKNYMYRMLEVNKNLPLDDQVILRRGANEKKVEVTAAELKLLINSRLAHMIQEVDKTVNMMIGVQTNIKIYHVGKISKIAHYEIILKEASKFGTKLAFPKVDVFGANENWTIVIVGAMLLVVNKEIMMYREEMKRKQMMEQSMRHQQQVQTRPVYGQQSGFKPSPSVSSQYAMQMAQKSFIK